MRIVAALIGALFVAGALAARGAGDIAGSYEVRVCKAPCAFTDAQAPAASGMLVLFDAELAKHDVEDIDPFHVGMPYEKFRACFSGMQFDNAQTLAFGTQRGVSAWAYDDERLTLELFRSVDAGYEVALAPDGALLRGEGTSWGAGAAAPGFSPDLIIARRVGAPDISWCAKTTTGFIDPHAADAEVVRQAVLDFAASLSASERGEFQRAGESDLALFHLGAGSRIRERYFSRNSPVRQAFCGANAAAFCNIDAASAIMVRRTWEQVRQTDGGG